MKMLVAAVSGAAVSGLFVVMHAATPWFGASTRESFSLASSQFVLPAGQSVAVLSVPSNKELTLTDVGAYSFAGCSPIYLELDERDSSGVDVTKVPEGFFGVGPSYGNGDAVGHSDGHGIVIGPGHDVVIKCDPNAGAQFQGSYLIVGYWSDR